MSEAPVDDLATAGLSDEEVVAARLEVVAAAADEPVQLGVFTDEELAALDDLSTSPVQPSPWYTSLSEAEKQIAMTAALRGLTARGVYRATPVDAQTRTFTAAIDPNIMALLTLRRYVDWLVVVERTTAEVTEWALLYPQRGRTFVIEYVDRVGLHEFVATDAETAVQAMIEWTGGNLVAVEESTPTPPAPELDVRLTRPEIEQRPSELEPLAACLFSSLVTRLDPAETEEDEWRAVHAGLAGSFVAAPDGEAVHYRGVDVDELATWWDEVLR